MGNDENVDETKEVRECFNEKIFDYIRKVITAGNQKGKTEEKKNNFDIIDELNKGLNYELNLQEENKIDYQYNENLKYGMIVLQNNIDIKKKTVIKNKDLFLYSPEYAYYLNENKTKLFIIIEYIGKKVDIDVKRQVNRGNYVFVIEGKSNDSKKNSKFLIKFYFQKKKHNIQFKNNKKKIDFENGIFTIEYEIETISNQKKNYMKDEKNK